MAICERCNRRFTPVDEIMKELCEDCINEII